MSATASRFFVDADSDPVAIRVEGRASFQNSGAIKDFLGACITGGRRRFVMDFEACTTMDSTFLGVLAGAALQLRRTEPAGTLVFPMSPTTAPDTGDCYAFVPAAFLPNRGPDIVGERATLHVASRRESAGRTLEINLVLVDQAEIYEDEIDATIVAMERFFGAAGITVGDVWLYELDMGWDSVIDVDGDEPSELRAIPLEDAADNSVNVYLFDDAFESGLYGIAAGIPGPVAVQGTAGSGVIVIIGTHLLADRETLDTNELGGTIAHEIGHQLGLFHTTEADGLDFDILSDTPECPSSFDADRDGEVSAEECRERDGGHILFWTSASFPQQTWSAQQRDVLARSPVMKR
jgi:anti-anti-sigma regulatory factor